MARKFLDMRLSGHVVDFYLHDIDDWQVISSADPLNEVTDYDMPSQVTIDLDGNSNRKVIIAQPIMTDNPHVFYAEVINEVYEPLVFLGEIDPAN